MRVWSRFADVVDVVDVVDRIRGRVVEGGVGKEGIAA